ncbi:zf-U1-domain-containing protein [Rhizodiscina lignyota]|uniref:U1 small nuclear ribonucleoprotein C n=1 Tax=Rhizodiscina lignyota TaxID=1504668 RepID=A0A9P4I7R9_9PEZI|nr:zf-U1-domain-containing protein [Rhizodiscina lignyota]
MPKYKYPFTLLNETASLPSVHSFVGDYCDVYLTHDSMSVRKAHNSGRNHLRNVVDYYQQIGHEKAQSVIDSITSSYAAAGQSDSNPMLQHNHLMGGPPMPGAGPGFPPPPFGFPPGGPPPFPMPPGGRGMPPNMPPNMPPMPPFPPNMPPGQMPFPQAFPPHSGSPPNAMPFPPPGGMPPNFPFPPPGMGAPPGMGGPPGSKPPGQ